MTTLQIPVGVDPGYGYTKGSNGMQSVKFPSILGPAIEIQFNNGLGQTRDGLKIQLKGESPWFIGDMAKHSPFQISPLARQRDVTIVKRLTIAALHQLGCAGMSIDLCTGLPLKHFSADRNEWERILIGEHEYAANEITYRLEINTIWTVPQPFGTLVKQMTNELGQITDDAGLKHEKVGIIDIGTHTTNFLHLDALCYDEDKSTSIDVGMGKVRHLLSQRLQNTFNLSLTTTDLERALHTRKQTYKGNTMPLGDIINTATSTVWTAIKAQAVELWGNALDFACVIITGGGALTFFEHTQHLYPHTILAPSSQIANAEGFRRYVLLKQANKATRSVTVTQRTPAGVA